MTKMLEKFGAIIFCVLFMSNSIALFCFGSGMWVLLYVGLMLINLIVNGGLILSMLSDDERTNGQKFCVWLAIILAGTFPLAPVYLIAVADMRNILSPLAIWFFSPLSLLFISALWDKQCGN